MAEGQAVPGFSIGEAISYGWAAFKKQPGPLLLVVLVVFIVSGIFNGLGYAFDSVVLQFVFQLLSIFVSIVISMGLIRVGLKITRGETAEVGDLFSTEHLGQYIGASILFTIIFTIGLILCIIPGIIAAVVLGFFGFAVIDRGADVTSSLSISADITQGHRGTLFGFYIVLGLLNLLGALLCGVGLLVTYPVSIVAVAYAYRKISGEPIAPIAA